MDIRCCPMPHPPPETRRTVRHPPSPGCNPRFRPDRHRYPPRSRVSRSALPIRSLTCTDHRPVAADSWERKTSPRSTACRSFPQQTAYGQHTTGPVRSPTSLPPQPRTPRRRRPRIPAAVSTLFGSNTTVHPNVSCTLRPHPRISLVPCRPMIPHPYFAASKAGVSVAVNCGDQTQEILALRARRDIRTGDRLIPLLVRGRQGTRDNNLSSPASRYR